MRSPKGKRIILCIIECCLVLAVLLGCFRPEKVIYAWEEGAGDSLQGIGGDGSFRSPVMDLRPGVYQVRLRCDTRKDQSVTAELKSDTAGYRAILGNSVYVFPGQTSVDFEVYVTSGVHDAYVECIFSGAGTEVLEELAVCRTSWGCRMVLFWLLCAIAIVEGMLHWRGRILAGQVTVRAQVVFWALAAGVLLAYMPYWTDYFSLGADTGFHLLRIEGLKESLLNGDRFPVRVQSYWLYDHGNVVSSMYGDLFLLFPALLRIIGFPLMSAYKMFVFAVTAATAWIAYIAFRKCVRDDYMALVGSLFYLLAPYRIYNIFARGAEGEYMAMTFLPLLCCGMYLLYTEDPGKEDYRRHKWWIVAGMSALLQCHPLTAELAAGFMFVVCAVFWRKTFRRATFLQLAQAVIWVLLLNLWFLIPMVYLLGADQYHLQQEFGRDIQQTGTQLAGVFQLWPNMGSGGQLMYESEPIQIGAAGIGCLMLFGAAAAGNRKYREKASLCLCGLTLLALVLSTRYFPWNLLAQLPGVKSFVTSLQFPTRIMIMASVFAAMFAAVFLDRFVREEGHAKAWICAGVLLTLAVGSALYQTNDILLERGSVRLYTAENMGTTSSWSRNFIFAENEQEEFSYHQPVAEEGLLWWNYDKKGTNIRIAVKNESGQVRYLELPLLGYRGYGVRAREQGGETDGSRRAERTGGVPAVAEERGAHGDLKIAVPAGYEGELEISYRGNRLFDAAEWISIGSLILGAAGAIVLSRRERGKGKTHGTEAENC